MRIAIVFLAVVSVGYCGILAPITHTVGVTQLNTGVSSQSRSQDNHGNYAFAYDENSGYGGSFRQETGGKGYATGSYGLQDADGRKRTVKYVADALGFRAQIETNEPGVDASKDPAAVSINKGYAPIIATPIIAAPAIAAPIVAYSSDYNNGGYNNGLNGGYNGGYNGGSYGGIISSYNGGLNGGYNGDLNGGYNGGLNGGYGGY